MQHRYVKLKSSIFQDTRNSLLASYLLLAGLLLGIFFNPEDGDMFLRNVG
jgi:hypothetical protein